MDLAVAGFFTSIAILMIVLALFQEKNHDGEDSTDHMIIIFLFFSTLCGVFAGISVLAASVLYVDCAGTLQVSYLSEYRPYGWAGICLSFIPGIMMATKIFDLMGRDDS